MGVNWELWKGIERKRSLRSKKNKRERNRETNMSRERVGYRGKEKDLRDQKEERLWRNPRLKEREEEIRSTGWKVKTAGGAPPPPQLPPQGPQRLPGLIFLGLETAPTGG